MKHYDTIVIGSGGGTKLVRPVADLGRKVAIAEMESPGGTCLNRGCIPSKMLIYPADIIHLTKDLSRLNIQKSDKWNIDFQSMIQRISNTVDSESASIPPVYDKHPNIDFYPHRAKFIGEKEISVGGEIITGDRIFLAVGCRPMIPHIKGLDKTPYWTSREALRSETIPKRLVVLGAGFIALELGMAYAAFGSKVDFIARSRVLGEVDHDIREAFCKHASNTVNFYENTNIQEVEYKDGIFKIQLTDDNDTILEADALLIATGIRPNTDDLGLENTKITLDRSGYIETNSYLETTQKNIFALGDVIGRYFFRHSVNFEGEYLFDNLYKKEKQQPIHYPPMPSAIFTYPEIANVGLTEEECRNGGFDYLSVIHNYSGSATGMARLPEVGFVKILVDRKTRKLLGTHIIGDEASNLIHLMIFGMTMGSTIEDYLNMIYIHPALPEIARNAFRKARDLLA
ncbi:dihydrolipoyl dehydrogenase [Leptospira sp. GIMC2001]|uniref:dihydrolipoyl dehydrogenase n=1 Tax=Leptospira sp. GIMC2001 TaxID=1513297 RepID=UPI00234B8036|nr:dihydrolipoyl dehydrogenase [Leptospira sp. GIMC2001]WCL51147.1 dihydrolipoyl dehydrogenase [Leptospira sp. GIMC2001]